MPLIIPRKYKRKLLTETTEIAIKQIKEEFQSALAEALKLRRVTAPLFVESGTGINDDLNGTEHAVSFTIDAMEGRRAEVVHSLAKWKRAKLAAYDIAPGFGIYTDMNAIRTFEDLDNIHSLYVDQWDWEKTIALNDRNLEYLKKTVREIYGAIKRIEETIFRTYPHITPTLPDEISFFHAQELLDRYPGLTPRERETEITRKYGAVFIIGIGGRLSDGQAHDGRAPDYDDWSTPNSDGYNGLNGDIVLWNRVLDIPFEISSMGIRVDESSIVKQLEKAGCMERAALPFQKAVIEKRLPYTIGGGIGQSRICMFFLRKAHIGEVQSSIWREDTIAAAKEAGVRLL